MLYRCLTLTVLVTLSLGCAGNHGGKVTLQKTLGPGGRAGSRFGASKSFSAAGCLNLGDFVRQLREDEGGLGLHSRDYDLGQISFAPGDHRIEFTAVTDRASRDLRARRARTEGNAPIYRVSSTAAELLDAKPLSDLLQIEAQTGCDAIKFKSGQTFKVEYADRTSLTLSNALTHERREYVLTEDAAILTVFAPVSLKTCAGQPSPAKFERISMRLTWGESLGTVRLVSTYASTLGLPEKTSFVQFQKKIESTEPVADARTCAP